MVDKYRAFYGVRDFINTSLSVAYVQEPVLLNFTLGMNVKSM